MSIEYKDWYPKVTSACFNLTDACNLRCRYCFVEQKPHFMTLDIAKKGVEFLVNNYNWKKEHNVYTDGVCVTYFGGEPMLLYEEIIKPLTLWCEETYPGICYFTITTNGTLLNEERIDFLYEHNIKPLLSIDGAPNTQNYNRPCQDPSKNSFDLVWANIPHLLTRFPYVTFRSTIDRHTVQNTYENYLFAAACGFQNIYMIPNSQEEWSQEELNLLDQEFEKIFASMLHEFRSGYKPLISFQPINDGFSRVLQRDLATINNELNNYKTNSRSELRCGVGITGCSIAYDGTIYGCQEQDSKTCGAMFQIGNIFDGVDIDKHINLLQNYIDNTHITECIDSSMCDKCPLRPLCISYVCPSSSWSSFGNLYTNGKSYCHWNQIIFKYCALMMHILTEENNEAFHTYLKEDCNFDSFFKEGY